MWLVLTALRIGGRLRIMTTLTAGTFIALFITATGLVAALFARIGGAARIVFMAARLGGAERTAPVEPRPAAPRPLPRGRPRALERMGGRLGAMANASSPIEQGLSSCARLERCSLGELGTPHPILSQSA